MVWLQELNPGDYPAFLRDGQTSAERNADGKPLRPGDPRYAWCFDSLDEAKTFCERKMGVGRDLRCDIYDHSGLVAPPVCPSGAREWNPGPKML